MSFGSGPFSGTSPFTLSGRQLEHVASYRYLGIAGGRQLSFKEHSKHLAQRAQQVFRLLRLGSSEAFAFGSFGQLGQYIRHLEFVRFGAARLSPGPSL